MSTTVNCDLCGEVIPFDPIKVYVDDGEHPHNGDTITRRIDMCNRCMQNVVRSEWGNYLKLNVEFDELERFIKQKVKNE